MNKLLCLKWNNHSSEFDRFLNRLYLQEIYSDGTLVCHGQFFPIHSFVLSTCSDYFEDIFNHSYQMKCKHPFIIIKDISPEQIQALLNFMYKGEVSIHQDMLPELLTAAEIFKIKGLAATDGNEESEYTATLPIKSKKRSLSSSPSCHSKRRKRLEEKNKNKVNHENATIFLEKNYQSVPSRDANIFQPDSEVFDEVKIEPAEFTDAGQNVLHNNDDALFSASKTDQSLNSWNKCCQNDQNDFSDIAQTSSWHETHDLSMKNNKETIDSSPGIVDLCHVAFSEENSDLWGTSDEFSHHSTNLANESNEAPLYSCSNCQFQCKSKFNMKRHIVIKHAEDKPFKCSFCPYQCASEDSLKTHTRKHTGEKPFICPHCPYRATQNVHLQTHLKTHTGEKPFQCPLCSFKASQKYSLNFHMKKHQHQTNNMG